MKCPKCGADIKQGVQLCTWCGMKFVQPRPPVVLQPARPLRSAMPVPSISPGFINHVKHDSARKLMTAKVLISAVGVILALGALGGMTHVLVGAVPVNLPFLSRFYVKPYNVVFDGSYSLNPAGSDVPMATNDLNDLKLWGKAEPARSYMNGELDLESTGDISTMSDLRSSGRILMIHDTTKAQVIAESAGWRKVRVTEGFHAGQIGWVSKYAVRRPDETPMEMQADEQTNPMQAAIVNQDREKRGLEPYKDNPEKVRTSEPLQNDKGQMYFLPGYSQPGGPDIPRPGYTYPCGPDAHQPAGSYPCTPIAKMSPLPVQNANTSQKQSPVGEPVQGSDGQITFPPAGPPGGQAFTMRTRAGGGPPPLSGPSQVWQK